MWRGSYALALVLVGGVAAPALLAQTASAPNEYEAKTQLNVQDKGEVWVLKFRFYPPRMITVDIPGRGRKLCWYMLFHVSNPDTKEPHRFIPDFELVTNDVNKRTVSPDQVLPAVQKAIQQVEDPNQHLDIKNSVTIAATPIPPSKADAVPRYITGVAIWVVGDGKGEVNPETNQFSVLVTGLSNGWSVDDKEVIRRKTLKLNFRRLGDRNSRDGSDIRFIQPEQWEYLTSNTPQRVAVPPKPPENKPADAKPGAAQPPPGVKP
jgi:hypothetical protein